MQINKTLATTLKPEPDWNNLGFGKIFTDHMFIMDYTEGQGWHDARIVPYAPLQLDPAAIVLHYAVEIFEGMKAYQAEDGRVLLFRPAENAKRMNKSGERLCIPELPEEYFLTALKELIKIEKRWIPKLRDTSLYIRPMIIATEAVLGISRSNQYQFIIILSPVAAFYPEGLNPVKIYVEEKYSRSVKGGTGYAKCGGNYAAGLPAQYKARDKGYSQVLWLDGATKTYIDEVGAMNVMFKINNEIYTPGLTDTILPGITRDSVIKLLKSWGYTVHEGNIPLAQLQEAAKNGTFEEAWGTGTAAVIAPIGELNILGESVVLSDGKTGELTQRIYNALTDIQWGRAKDEFGWTEEL